jgi:superfamily II DNA/RNA helicase
LILFSLILFIFAIFQFLALIIVPTRELAIQTLTIAKELSEFLKNIKIQMITGGTSVKDDILALKEPGHVLVGIFFFYTLLSKF